MNFLLLAMNKMFRLFFLICLVAITPHLFAQDDKEIASLKVKQALVFEGNGKTAEAIPLLEEAVKLDPGNINMVYELALVYATVKDYIRSKTLLEPKCVLYNSRYPYGVLAPKEIPGGLIEPSHFHRSSSVHFSRSAKRLGGLPRLLAKSTHRFKSNHGFKSRFPER